MYVAPLYTYTKLQCPIMSLNFFRLSSLDLSAEKGQRIAIC